ncbi:hypothetical protein WICPIJ_008507 [Wickerhamomyces pijperi]|uniref:Uncharacterized protein n=1 Tax=Wickerhamomyces pijperi TaxID=599730 RepID=A0A9P8TIF6_WICPI|nr:hypothetical protein WICPIJ_008507 [Wickerhamomyces pijperi]
MFFPLCEELVFVLNDQGVGKDQNTDDDKPFDKPQPLDHKVKVRVCKATLSMSNPMCSYSKKLQINCSSHCKNPYCDKKKIKSIFIDTQVLVLVKSKDGQNIEESDNTNDFLENYLPVSCDFLARAGVSRLVDLHDNYPHTSASPYYCADLSKRPTNLSQQWIDLELCARIKQKTSRGEVIYESAKRADQLDDPGNNNKRVLEEAANNSGVYIQQTAKRQQNQRAQADFDF